METYVLVPEIEYTRNERQKNLSYNVSQALTKPQPSQWQKAQAINNVLNRHIMRLTQSDQTATPLVETPTQAIQMDTAEEIPEELWTDDEDERPEVANKLQHTRKTLREQPYTVTHVKNKISSNPSRETSGDDPPDTNRYRTTHQDDPGAPESIKHGELSFKIPQRLEKVKSTKAFRPKLPVQPETGLKRAASLTHTAKKRRLGLPEPPLKRLLDQSEAAFKKLKLDTQTGLGWLPYQ